tara:strand:- start:11530 stop:12333 length:804 start_codon:yes stop_codon:yes gene_type:complete
MTTFELYNANCLVKMKELPDKSVDLIICDLPYGCLTTGKGKEKLQRADNPEKPNDRETGLIVGCAWDIKINLDEFWKQVKRIRKDDHTPCIHFCNTKFGNDLINSNPDEFRYDLVWNKMRGVGFLSVNKKPMSSHEMLYIFSKKGAKYNRIDIAGEPYTHKKSNTKTKVYNTENVLTTNTGTRCVLSVIDESSFAKKDQHPTAKPDELYRWLISRYSNAGGLVLDPTFGSCNSGAVARELGRNYIGIEMNKDFFDKAVERLLPPINA